MKNIKLPVTLATCLIISQPFLFALEILSDSYVVIVLNLIWLFFGFKLIIQVFALNAMMK